MYSCCPYIKVMVDVRPTGQIRPFMFYRIFLLFINVQIKLTRCERCFGGIKDISVVGTI
jgi:hypothetical protein